MGFLVARRWYWSQELLIIAHSDAKKQTRLKYKSGIPSPVALIRNVL